MKFSFLLFWVLCLVNCLEAKPLQVCQYTQDSLPNFRQKTSDIITLQQRLVVERTKQIQQLEEALKSGSNTSADRKKKQKALNTLKQDQRLSYWKIDQCQRLLTEARLLQYKTAAEKQKGLSDLEKRLKKINQSRARDVKELHKGKEFVVGTVSHKVYDFQIASTCQLEYNPATKIRANEFRQLFSYTDPSIESFFKERDFINCKARFLKSGKNLFLEFRITFTSPRANQIYGNLDSGSPTKISFMNGDHIYLNSYLVSTGKLEANTGNTVYTIQYKLDKEDIKNLKKREVDTVSFIWSTGVEEYDLYDIVVFKELLECIRKKN